MKIRPQWELIGAFLTAITASVCCVVPLLLVGLGISGAWVSNLKFFEPYRPIFIIITLILLGFAFYRIYRKPQNCSSDSVCANPRRDRIMKRVLIVTTAFILGLLAFPYAVPYVFGVTVSQRNLQTNRVVLEIKNMTCASCLITVKNALMQVQGVQDAIVTFDPPEAIVVYDPSKLSVESLTA
jgi:copper chaperone CopZ